MKLFKPKSQINVFNDKGINVKSIYKIDETEAVLVIHEDGTKEVFENYNVLIEGLNPKSEDFDKNINFPSYNSLITMNTDDINTDDLVIHNNEVVVFKDIANTSDNNTKFGHMHILQYIDNRDINLNNKSDLDKEFNYAKSNYKVNQDTITDSPYIKGHDNGGHNTLTKYSGQAMIPNDMTIDIAIDSDDAGDFYFTDLQGNVIGNANFYGNHGICECKDHNATLTLKKGIYKVFIRLQDRGGNISLSPFIKEDGNWVNFKDSKFFKNYIANGIIQEFKVIQ